MSASNCPETPRQKMIQMMYLVYTAMLALNVAATVLEGFRTVGDAMEKSNFSVGQKIVDSYDQFDRLHENNPEKTAVQYQKAQEVRKLSHDLKYYIDTLSYGLICYVQAEVTPLDHSSGKKSVKLPKVKIREGAPDDGKFYIDTVKHLVRKYGLEIIEKSDNNNDGTRYFFNGSEPKQPAEDCRCMVLKRRIIEYKQKLKEILGPDSSEIQIALNVEGNNFHNEHGGNGISWEMVNFDNTIIIADVVVLQRLRAEVMTAEYDAVRMLYNQVSADDFKFDQVKTMVRPTSSLVMQGGKYEASVGLGAFDSKSPFRVVINGQSYTSDGGAVEFSQTATAPGEKKLHGTIYVKKDNEEKSYDFDESYFVMEPMAVVSLTQMNVVYNGIDNPVKISVPGVAAKDLVVEIKAPADGKTPGAATIIPEAGKAGHYIIRPSKLGKIEVSVSAKMDGKQVRHMGSYDVRVKRIPDPVIMIGSNKPGSILFKAEFESNPMRVTIPDFDFQLATPLRLEQYEFSVSGSGKLPETVQGGRLGPEQISLIKNARKNSKVYISSSIKTPDGVSHPIDVSFRIK